MESFYTNTHSQIYTTLTKQIILMVNLAKKYMDVSYTIIFASFCKFEIIIE
jgi:hypothetical protein